MAETASNPRLHGTSPPTAAPASESGLLQTQEMSLEQLRRFAESGYLYAILDATDAPAVPPKMEEMGEQRAVSLFHGNAQEQYWAVVPYLVAVDPPTLDWIVETLWKEPWGIFVLAKADLGTLSQHFRRFLVVQLPDGEKWFFRFYDPRMLKTYLTNCTAQELNKFFESIRAIGVAGSAPVCMEFLMAGARNQQVFPTHLPGLTIRREQAQELDRKAAENFLDRMVAHVCDIFPTRPGAPTLWTFALRLHSGSAELDGGILLRNLTWSDGLNSACVTRRCAAFQKSPGWPKYLVIRGGQHSISFTALNCA